MRGFESGLVMRYAGMEWGGVMESIGILRIYVIVEGGEGEIKVNVTVITIVLLIVHCVRVQSSLVSTTLSDFRSRGTVAKLNSLSTP